MRKHLIRILSACLMLLSMLANAQERNISGKVTDAKSGAAMQGVTVTNTKTNKGAQTDNAGNYTIAASTGDQLRFSFVGFVNQTITVGQGSTVNVALATADSELGDVVVTALGIKKQKRSVGYATNDVSGEKLAETQRDNFVNSLAGRLPGVTVTGTTGMPGASTNIQLRGVNSLSGSNQPLFVINGLPINNQTFNANNLVVQTENRTIDFSSRIGDLNPEDIESVTVLKGPEAAALYGIDAANGAIVITTKKGQAGAGKLSYSYNFGYEKVGNLPKFDRIYSRGQNGIASDNTFLSFGPKYAPTDTLYNNSDGFFENGMANKHSLSFEGGVDQFTYRLSGGYTTRKGVVPTTKYDRMNVSADLSSRLFKNKLKIDLNMQYVYTYNQKVSKGNNSFLLGILAWPADDDMRNYLNPNGTRKRLTTGTEIENPYFDVEKNELYDKGNRFVTNLGLNFDVNEWLSLNSRIGADVYGGFSSVFYHPESNRAGGSTGGSIDNANQTTRLITVQNFVQAKHKMFGNKLDITARLGNAIYDYDDNTYAVRGERLLDPDFNSLNNTDITSQRQRTTLSQKRVVGVWGTVDLAWQDWIYATVTGRNDWTSTLPDANNSFFYPSVSASFIASEFYKNTGLYNVINYLKLRASIAQVGKDARPYSLYPALEAQTTTGGGYGYGFTAPNPVMRPEKVTSRELGVEMQFFKNRVGLDVAVYKSTSVDQIINGLRISYGTGYILKNINGGELENSGIEAMLRVGVIQQKDFRWEISLNGFKTESKLTKMPDGVPEYYNSDTWLYGNVRNGARLNGPLTTLTAAREYQKNTAGQLLINPSTGLPLFTDYTIWPIAGDRNPDFRGGIGNTFNYKGINLNFNFDVRMGGDVYNATGLYMYTQGLHQRTIDNREVPVTFDGVMKDGLENTANPTPNNVVINPYYNNTFYTSSVIDQEFIERDVNWFRLRDITLSYNIPASWLKKSGFIKAANVGVTGTDLFMITNYSGGDPGVNGTTTATGGSGSSGIDYGNLPVSKTFNFTLRVSL